MTRSHLSRVALAAACGLMLVIPVMHGDQAPPGTAASRPAAQVRLTKAEAAAFAKDARTRVNVDMPAGVELTLWASERLISDPIAIDVDPDGTAYVISSSRADLPNRSSLTG